MTHLQKVIKLKNVDHSIVDKSITLEKYLKKSGLDFNFVVENDYIEFSFKKNGDLISFGFGIYRDGVEYSQTEDIKQSRFRYLQLLTFKEAITIIENNDFSWAGKRFF